MNSIACRLFPGGRSCALTLSYDDGNIHDRRLVETMNRHGIRGTFHLNGAFFGRPHIVAKEEVATLFTGHEVSAHGFTHPWLDALPSSQVAVEILDDRRSLESLVGYPVRGMSYPFGAHSEAVRRQLPSLGIEYARVVTPSENFEVPEDFLQWRPTCHHKHPRLAELTDKFLGQTNPRRMQLFYLWGHSFEFDRENNWDLIETFCERMGGKANIWYATNIEIVDYLNAVRGLRIAAAGNAVQNPAGVDVWIEADGVTVKVPAGGSVRL